MEVRGEWQQGPGQLTVPSLPASVSRIRRFASAACRDVAGGSVCETVELLVREVAHNALVHGAGDVRVDVRTRGGAVRIEVSDDGRGTGHDDGRGNGLRGMSERVKLLGGRLEAGPGPRGGFTVRAVLPIEERHS